MRDDTGTHTEADAAAFERAHTNPEPFDYPDLPASDYAPPSEPFRGWDALYEACEGWVGVGS